MKLITLKNNLKEALAAVGQGVGENSNLPILKHILIRVTGNACILAATNLEIGITRSLSVKIQEPGGLTIPFSTIYNVVANSDSERIALESDKANLVVKTDDYRAVIQGMPESDFPIIPQIQNKTNYLEINSTVLKQALGSAVMAAQVSEIRPEISGILFDFQLQTLKLAATDTFRLAEKTLRNTEWKSTFYEGWKAVVPLKTIQEVIRIFPEDQTIKIFTDPSQIAFVSDNQTLISRLIDGQYPDYEHIIPREFKAEILVNREKLINAVKLASGFAGRSNDVKIKTAEGAKAIRVYAASQAVGENQYLIPVKTTSDIPEVVFNWRYLLDGLRPHAGEAVLLGVVSDARPVLIKNPDDASYFYILMPIRSS